MVLKMLSSQHVSVMTGFIMFTGMSSFRSLRANLDFLFATGQLYRTTAIARTSLGFPGTRLFADMQERGFDLERSTPFVLYPEFLDNRVRQLSIAMEENEIAFAPIDQRILVARLALERVKWQCGDTDSRWQKGQPILDDIASVFYSATLRIFEMAERGAEARKLSHHFQQIRPQMESLRDRLERSLR